MMLRVLTRFRGLLVDAEHDSAAGAVVESGGAAMPCGLAEWLRACARQARLHRLLGLRYRVSQEIEDDGRPDGQH